MHIRYSHLEQEVLFLGYGKFKKKENSSNYMGTQIRQICISTQKQNMFTQKQNDPVMLKISMGREKTGFEKNTAFLTMKWQ